MDPQAQDPAVAFIHQLDQSPFAAARLHVGSWVRDTQDAQNEEDCFHGRSYDVAGLTEIKKHGGLAIVQDPAEAIFPDLPRSALAAVEVDACLPVAQIRALVTHLPNLPGYKRVRVTRPGGLCDNP